MEYVDADDFVVVVSGVNERGDMQSAQSTCVDVRLANLHLVVADETPCAETTASSSGVAPSNAISSPENSQGSSFWFTVVAGANDFTGTQSGLASSGLDGQIRINLTNSDVAARRVTHTCEDDAALLIRYCADKPINCTPFLLEGILNPGSTTERHYPFFESQ